MFSHFSPALFLAPCLREKNFNYNFTISVTIFNVFYSQLFTVGHFIYYSCIIYTRMTIGFTIFCLISHLQNTRMTIDFRTFRLISHLGNTRMTIGFTIFYLFFFTIFRWFSHLLHTRITITTPTFPTIRNPITRLGISKSGERGGGL